MKTLNNLRFAVKTVSKIAEYYFGQTGNPI